MTEEEHQTLTLDYPALAADIGDVTDENPSDEIISINEIESLLMKIE